LDVDQAVDDDVQDIAVVEDHSSDAKKALTIWSLS
jgi:hypothetical protein